MIVLGEKTLLDKFGYSIEEVIRHETAHCNGWPSHAD
jgi:hypothetical protein